MDQSRRKPATADDATIDQVEAFADRLLDKLAATVPLLKTDDPDDHAGRREVARVLFNALQPQDDLQAALAAKATAAYLAGMDMFARAAQPEVSDTAAIRLRNSALTASRSFDNTLRTLRNSATRASAAAPTATPVRPEPKRQPLHTPRSQPLPDPRINRLNQAAAPNLPIVTPQADEPTFAQSVRAQALSRLPG